MTVGIELMTDGGKYQIRGGIRTPSLAAKGSVASTTNGALQFGTWVQISYTKHSASMTWPMCAIRPASSAVACYPYSKTVSGNTVTWNFVCNGAAGTSIPYWIFDYPNGSSPTTCGLQFWDDTGQLIFDSGRWPMRATPPFLTGDLAAAPLGSSSTTYTSGRTYAAIICRQGIDRQWRSYGAQGQSALFNYLMSVYGVTDGIGTNWVLNGRTNEGTTDPTSTVNAAKVRVMRTRMVMPVDVTNY